MRSVLAGYSFLIVLAISTAAHAWSDPPLCSMAETEQPMLPVVATEVGASECRVYPQAQPEAQWFEFSPQRFSKGFDEISAARTNLREAERLLQARQRENALLQLRAVERAVPRVADRFALRRGDLLLELAMPEQACEAYSAAAQSPNREVAVRAQVGLVHCLLQAGDRKGERALAALLTRYPRLTQRHLLNFELAMARERWGSPRGAAALLREIDLADPASGIAEHARAELVRLAAEGNLRVAPYSPVERVERAERLLFDAPLELAAAEVEALQQDRALNAELRARVLLLSARIARIQGRFDDAQRARKAAALSELGKTSQAIAQRASVVSAADHEAVERRIRTIRAGRAIARLNNGQLRNVFELAVANDFGDVCDEVLDAMRSRRGLDAAVRFGAAIRASGLASDQKLASLFETLLDVPRYRLSSRYHYARALERLGRAGEAEAEYLRVIASDRNRSPYYAMWADLRLWTLRSQKQESCLPHDPPATARGLDARSLDAGSQDLTLCVREGTLTKVSAGEPARGGAAAGKELLASDTRSGLLREVSNPGHPLATASFDRVPTAVERKRAEHDATDTKRWSEVLGQQVLDPDATAASRRQRVLDLLAPIAARHADAYPWLVRAQDLIELELFDEAADEINEAYLAFRDASGALRLRSGLLALLTGSAPPRRAVTYALGKARRALERDERMTLSEVANLLGDPGVGVRFGKERLDDRPRAYAELVENAAHKHGLDPNLLFAVMRVESIYNRRIVSNAGAVGLMQIMPATGERIARKLGLTSFDATELLDPRLNLDFSAWYLRSLLQRFDGRLPLAIASYNGGPHNVRLWLHENSPRMPLDAFLERIPFSQTHEYVRRVLTYYAQYRAQQNLPMTRLSVELPPLRPDTMAF